MSVGDFVGILERIMDDPGSAASYKAALTEFVEGDAVAMHIRATTLGLLNRQAGLGFGSEAAEAENPGLMLNRVGADGVSRRLVLRSQGNTQPFHSTHPDPYVIVAMSDDMVVDELRVVGATAETIYSKPSSALKLELVRSHKISKGDVLVRTDPLTVLDVRLLPGLRYLIFLRGNGESSFQVAFTRDTLQCIATTMSDVAATKAIALLEILEHIRSSVLPVVATEFTEHYSPIVRWRALSSMNKIAHPRTREILERFCNDEVAFIREGAQRALSKGKS